MGSPSDSEISPGTSLRSAGTGHMKRNRLLGVGPHSVKARGPTCRLETITPHAA